MYFLFPFLITNFTSKILPNLDTKRIVITGGPATGKTAIIEYLKSNGFICFEEVIRKLTAAAKASGDIKEVHSNPIALVSDADQFNQTLINLRIADFLSSEVSGSNPYFYDRGMPDVLAYMSFFDQPIKKDFFDICETYKYDYMFLLPPWEAIFTDDEERFENFEQATAIYHHLKDTYTRFGYKVIEVPFGSINNRAQFILNHIKEL
ncbi:MAG: ATP-binding protein [Flavobacteriaceae bacterium]|nr:ATP-binding protein [Flavobacteriaceae bacterium]